MVPYKSCFITHQGLSVCSYSSSITPHRVLTASHRLLIGQLRQKFSSARPSLHTLDTKHSLSVYRVHSLSSFSFPKDRNLAYLLEAPSPPKMASKPVSKSAPGVESGSSAAGTTDIPKELQNWKIDNIPTSLEQQKLIFFTYKKLRHGGRLLAREEVIPMIAMILRKKTINVNSHGPLHLWLNKFDNDEHPVTVALESVSSNNEQRFLEKMFESYLQNDEEARDRCDNYKGLYKGL